MRDKAPAVLVSILALAVGSVLVSAAPAEAQLDAKMFRQPDVSESHITFVYAGDIWIVPKTGGTAHRLSSPAGEESMPRFSPDGSRIAFSGNYDGNTDVYVVPTMGGDLVRITYHPAPDRLLDWRPSGEGVLFASVRESGRTRFNQMYSVSASGGLPDKLPVPYGEFGTLSPDESVLAYMPKTRDFRTWKRYRGGMAPDIWLFDLGDFSATNLSDSDANDGHPMWHGRTVYFLSDRGPNQRNNIWAYDMDSQQSRQVTRFTDFDITFPAIGPSEIVFQAGGSLYLLDLANERQREVGIDVVTDFATLKPRNENVSRLIQAAGISPSGKRAVFGARGDVFTVPAEHGIIRNLTRSSGVGEIYPAWSPDGKQLAYWSDRSGEYELTVCPADGSGQEKQLTNLGPGYRYSIFWSPDSKKIAFVDHMSTIRIYDFDSDEVKSIDRTRYMIHPSGLFFRVNWSPDSNWITYSKPLPHGQGAIFLYDVANGRRHQVTSGYYSDSQPTFDPDGKYLYYLSNRTLRPLYSDLDGTWIYPNTTNVVAVPLRGDIPSPLAPRNDEESVEEEEGEADEDEGGGGGGEGGEAQGSETQDDEAEEEESLVIELEDFERRLIVLPPEAGNYSGLSAVSGQVIYHRGPRSGSSSRQSPLVAYNLEDREEKPIIDNTGGFSISADGKKILVSSRGAFGIVDARPGQKLEDRLRTAELEVTVDPKAEWRHLFNDVWRRYRDFFYDEEIHGVDWNAMRRQYGRLLEDAVTRWDVTFVIGELIGETSASHTYVGGGDVEQPERRGVGLLGVDWALENGAYRIARIVDGASWDAEVRSPLAIPGVDVSEGDYVLAVNGVPVNADNEPYAAFQGLAGETVTLTVNDAPTIEGAREVLVETLSSETRLRNLEWIEQNRQHVAEATHGGVGYD